jgi:Tfp pilus assembly protein FimV
MSTRRLLRLRFRAILVLLAVLALFAGILLGSDDSPAPAMRTVTVAPGDTLWELAMRHGPPHQDVRAVVDLICRANGLPSTRLTVGQELRVPRRR